MSTKIKIILFAVIILLLLVLSLVGYRLYNNYIVQKKMISLTEMVSGIASLSYKTAKYNAGDDLFVMEGLNIRLQNGRAIEAERAEFADFYKSTLVNIKAENVRYDLMTAPNRQLTIQQLSIARLDMDTVMPFVEQITSEDRNLAYLWLVSPLTIGELSVDGLEYRHLGKFISISNAKLTGPLFMNVSPEKLDISMGLNLSGLGAITGNYSRQYNIAEYRLKESYSNVSLNNRFILDFESELSNVDMGIIRQALNSGLSKADVLAFTDIERMSLTYVDNGLMRLLSNTLFYMDSWTEKNHAKAWLETKLPQLLPVVLESEALAEALASFIASPNTLKIEVDPTEPLPFSTVLDGNESTFDRLRPSVTVNEGVTLHLHEKAGE